MIDVIETNPWLKGIQNQLHLVSRGSTRTLNSYEIVNCNIYVNVF